MKNFIKISTKRIKSIPSIIILVVAVGLIGFSLLGFWYRYKATHIASHTQQAETVVRSVDVPDETPVDNCDNFRAAASEPRQINFPSLGKSGCIQKVGTDQHNAIAVPTNVHVAGWYVSKSLPGQPGLSIIDGHVSGRYSEGVFKHIGKLKPGDEFSVEFGDNSIKKFAITKVQDVPSGEADSAVFQKDDSINSQLNLITCSGKFNKKLASFSNRLIVTAKYLEP